MDEPTVYCEWLNGALHQPINTFSNIVFILVAVLLYRKIKQSDTKSWLITLLPFSILFMGISSGLWHYEASVAGDILDTLSIAIFAVLLSFIIISRLCSAWGARIAVVTGITIVALYLEQLPYLNGSLVYLFLFTVLGLSLYTLSVRSRANLLPVIAAVLLLLISFLARVADIHMCSSLEIGTHFVWHITIAFAVYYSVISLLATQEENR